VGAVPQGRAPILGERLAPGDDIVLIDSSGLHANGSSLARMIAGQLDRGYATELPSGRTFGEALLDPTPMYAGLVAELLKANVDIHYLSHITGHGLLKLMRPRRDLTYEIAELPEVPEVLAFLAQRAGMAPAEAYATLNMGCGFAVYCAGGAGETVVQIAGARGLGARVAGSVTAGPRRVILEPVGVRFGSDDMNLAPRS
jgi:phosphoribosylformylglycinamidine cyclo-ligase